MKKSTVAALAFLVCLVPLFSCSLLRGPTTLYIQAISDDSGGAIIGWQNASGIYVQHINSSGEALWQPGGIRVAVVPNTFDDYAPPGVQFTLTPDGAGGVIITWADTKNIEDKNDGQIYFGRIPVYSQRIDENGSLLWGEGIATGATAQIGSFPQVITDSTGSAIFAWNDFQPNYKALLDDYLRVQKLSPGGVPLWGNEGTLITTSTPYRPLTAQEIAAGAKGTTTRTRPTYDGKQTVVSDGNGGAFVLWEEDQSLRQRSAYLQHVDADGATLFPQAFLIGSGEEYSLLTVLSDDNGGLFAVGGGFGTEVIHIQPATGQIYPTKTTTTMLWEFSAVRSDQAGGLILSRSAANPPGGNPKARQNELFIQKLDKDCRSLWPQQTVFVTGLNQQFREDFVADDSGGAVVVWRLFENHSVDRGVVYIQKLDSQGRVLLPEEGIAAFNKPDFKYQGIPIMLDDRNGGAIVVAALGKNGRFGDMVYAQRMDNNGNLLWDSGIRIDL